MARPEVNAAVWHVVSDSVWDLFEEEEVWEDGKLEQPIAVLVEITGLGKGMALHHRQTLFVDLVVRQGKVVPDQGVEEVWAEISKEELGELGVTDLFEVKVSVGGEVLVPDGHRVFPWLEHSQKKVHGVLFLSVRHGVAVVPPHSLSNTNQSSQLSKWLCNLICERGIKTCVMSDALLVHFDCFL